jgi:hypothetical protein
MANIKQDVKKIADRAKKVIGRNAKLVAGTALIAGMSMLPAKEAVAQSAGKYDVNFEQAELTGTGLRIFVQDAFTKKIVNSRNTYVEKTTWFARCLMKSRANFCLTGLLT